MHARRVDRELARLFRQRLGSREHPRGEVISAYRQARRAMREAYGHSGTHRVVIATDILRTLRRQLYNTAQVAIREAMEIGRASVMGQAVAYALADVPIQPAEEWPDWAALQAGWQAAIDGQLDRVDALIRSGAEAVLVYGDADRMGALTPGPVQGELSQWIAMAASAAFVTWLVGREPKRERVPFAKQAVAAIDSRTTDCCLRVNGQVQPFNKPFRLTGTPRFADQMDWSPFHRYCRTSIVLYRKEFDNGLTEQLRADSEREMSKRKRHE